MKHAMILVAGAFASFMVANCGSDAATCDELATCGSSGTSGGGDGGPDTDVITPRGCDPTVDPKDAPACVDNSYAVFVSPSGNDGNPGTKESPLATITAAVGKGKARVYVCEGTYSESVKLLGSASIVGGFACETWNYSGVRPRVAPSAAGYALELTGSKAVLIADLSFEALAGTADRRSSIAVHAKSAEARFLRTELTAHEGKEGADAVVDANFDSTLAASNALLKGADAVGTAGGAEQKCLTICKNNDHSTGGAGGKGGAAPGPGVSGKPERGAGSGGVANNCVPNSQAGGIGAAGDDATAASVAGAVGADGWVPSAGAAAKAGGPGQGGGGGGGGVDADFGAGGGGACGGCGGAGGGAAEGGGGSVALLSIDSSITLTDVKFSAGTGGAGGKGIAGQSGQIGGNGGNPTSGGCLGVKGGGGGPGGASAGGAGGISVGVVYVGTEPSVGGQSSYATSEPGAFGLGGKPGSNDGPLGVKADKLHIP